MLATPVHPPSDPACPARYFALIPCAGSGTRAGVAGPKQYQPVAGRPLVHHTLAAFAQVPRIARTLVVVPPDDDWSGWPVLAAERVHCGGATRALSVLNGLRQMLRTDATPQDWVLVHDAARCLVTPQQIESLIDACTGDAVGGLLALPLPDTLKVASGDRVQGTQPRADKWLAQTPQMFRIGLLVRALESAGAAVTDESSAVEALGHQPLLVRGSAQNFKITYPEDFALADAVLHSRASVCPGPAAA